MIINYLTERRAAQFESAKVVMNEDKSERGAFGLAQT